MRGRSLGSAVACLTLLCLAAPSLGADVPPTLPEIPLASVPAGCFDMGDRHGDGGVDEKPVHRVCLDGFSLGTYEVTEGLWRAVTGTPPPGESRGDDYPVAGVSWNDVREFMARLRDRTGRKWRLPTEAEWEYAARSGGRDEKYPGTGSAEGLERHAWYEANSGGVLRPVGGKRANGLGIHDMGGNVWEWVQDRYGRDYYRLSPEQNPGGDPFGVNRVIRGGSALKPADFLRCSYRDYMAPDVRNPLTGFRLALSNDD